MVDQGGNKLSANLKGVCNFLEYFRYYSKFNIKI